MCMATSSGISSSSNLNKLVANFSFYHCPNNNILNNKHRLQFYNITNCRCICYRSIELVDKYSFLNGEIVYAMFKPIRDYELKLGNTANATRREITRVCC